MQDTASIIIGIASGIGGALAAVSAFLVAFRSLEKTVESAQKQIAHIAERLDTETRAIDTRLDEEAKAVAADLARTIDHSACDQCHAAFEKELARGSRHFDDLYRTQQAATNVLARMQTTLETLLLRTGTMEATLSRVTRVEIRLPTDPV